MYIFLGNCGYFVCIFLGNSSKFVFISKKLWLVCVYVSRKKWLVCMYASRKFVKEETSEVQVNYGVLTHPTVFFLITKDR